ncbi:MAG TPA: methyltransferase, partial [Anaerolineales bacterium]
MALVTDRIDGSARRMAETVLPSAAAIPSFRELDPRELVGVLNRSGYGATQELRFSRGPASLEDSPGYLLPLRRLFWRGELLSTNEAAGALTPLNIAALVEAGVLKEEHGGVRALFQIQVYDGLYFIVDFMPEDHPTDVVLPIGPSSKYLAEITIRKPVDSALDLGCGCGIQALLMSRHARQVAATDINPRAVELTRLNAALNGIMNVETLLGSYFEPVAGRTFDLLVANLPYVITPETRYIYRDTGQADDQSIRRNVEQAALHLREGGFAQIMLNWIHAASEAWWRPIENWTRQRNVDGWLLYSHSQTPEQYTKQWLMIDEARQPEEYASATRAWLTWYKQQHIERVGFGVLNLRRRSAPNNWRCSVHVSKTADEPLGKHVQHLFSAQDQLAGVGAP